MKKILLISILLFLTSLNLFAQNKLPENLQQAVIFLGKDCPDRVKKQIKNIHNDSLIYSVYPFAKTNPYQDYRTIFNWTSENGNPRITKYLNKKRIFDHQSEILLYAFKQYLINGKITEKEILTKYIVLQKKTDDNNKVKYTTDSINSVYIPKDLQDCFAQINIFWNEDTKTQVRALKEEEFTGKVHLGFGMWMRNNWQLWGGSRLSKYFNDLKIYHPDDMSGIILVSYHRYLNSKEIKLEEQVKYYQDYWESSEKKARKGKIEEFSKYKIGDKLNFNYQKGFVSKEQEDRYDNDTCMATGIITERNEKDFLIKVKLTETCDKKGVIYYDNEEHRIYDPKTKRWSKPPKRIIKKVKRNNEQWFEYKDWETTE
ncbi:hypothetical protein MP477_07310 [Chryseobacterium sp. WG23]|uniref:DUF6794 domain-containing protein n=1 Tax=Chryseobacterium sp. WG23 TaxID=2926910 RepID=UPI00211EF760|nr:DUF6794 domain-containing protein [Chryseobacterium sp. WG23]MCQ9634762.1 hypothetical protein [Chryseobacterium sp. WG23]